MLINLFHTSILHLLPKFMHDWYMLRILVTNSGSLAVGTFSINTENVSRKTVMNFNRHEKETS